MPKRIRVATQGKRPVWLSPEDRSLHMHVFGASGVGKSKALEAIIRQDIKAGHGVIVIDPHGSLYHDLVRWLTYQGYDRFRKIHLIDPSGGTSTVSFNPLWVRPNEDIINRVKRVVDAFAMAWGSENTDEKPRLSKVLTLVFYALARRNLSIVEGQHLLSISNQDGLREFLSSDLGDSYIQGLWNEYNAASASLLKEHFDSADSRFLKFLASPTIRAMLGSTDTPIDFRECMDNDEIVLVNLQDSNHLAEDDARVIGSLITNELFSLARIRPEPVAKKHPCYLYIDECYRYLSDDIEDMLNQTRKRGLHLTLAHHYLGQLKVVGDSVYYGVMTNAQIKMIFGGANDEDGEILAREIFRTEFDTEQEQEKLTRPMHDGTYHRETLNNRSTSEGGVDGESSGSVSGVSAGVSVAQSYDEDGFSVGGYIETDSAGESNADMSGSFSASTWNESQGEQEVLVPNFVMMPTSLKGLDIVVHQAISRIRSLGRQYAILKVFGRKKALNVKIPFVKKPPVSTRSIEAFTAKVIEKDVHALPRGEALAIIEDRREQLVRVANNRLIDADYAAVDDDSDFLQ